MKPGEAFLYGIPFPGSYVTDENGVVVSKFFHDTYKKRDSPELLIDAALGKITIADDAPQASGGDDEVKITAAIHGGKGTIRQGIRREVVVRFELGEGLHIYGEPVPEGMVPTSVKVSGPPGLATEPLLAPETEPLKLSSLDLELPVWSGTVDLRVPIYAVGELASETRPLDVESVPIEVEVRYQACDDDVCLLPKTETFHLDAATDVIDIPKIDMHTGHGQREGNYDGTRHLLRLLLRKIRQSPIGFLKFIPKQIGLELAARRRARQQG